MCANTIRKRQFPALYDFKAENKVTIYENIDLSNTEKFVKTEVPIYSDIFDKIPQFTEVVSNERHVFLVGGQFPKESSNLLLEFLEEGNALI